VIECDLIYKEHTHLRKCQVLRQVWLDNHDVKISTFHITKIAETDKTNQNGENMKPKKFMSIINL